MKPHRIRFLFLATLLVSLIARVGVSAQTDLPLYDDSLVNGWQNWSWATVDTSSTAVVHSGTHAIAITAGAWTALALHHDPVDTHGYSDFSFWINGGPVGGQTLNLTALLGGQTQPSVKVGPLVANTWTKFVVPLASLGAAAKANLDNIWLQEGTGVDQPVFYLDDVTLTASPPPAVVNVTVDANAAIRTVDRRLFGVNTAVWDGSFNTPTTQSLLEELNNQALRFPGGSASDVYHWATNTSDGQTFQWSTNFDAFSNIAKKTGAQVFITVNYGTGTAQEAADWVRNANVTKHLGFKYWEVGNENYGTWEADKNARPNDAVTYATRFKDYYMQMKAADPSIKVGAVVVTGEDSQANYADESAVNPRTGVVHHGWTPIMLATMKSLGVSPDFIIYHRYAQGPGGESDSFLLTSSATWQNDAASLRQMLNDYLGASGGAVELTCTENNSVYASPGKQTTSLVNGLFYADSLGNIMQTEFNSLIWWDFRNGQETANNNSASLYGWRQYGDYGIVTYAVPATAADRYPSFYVNKLIKYFARGGETVVSASSDYVGLGVYAVRKTDGTVRLMLINKHPSAKLNVSISVKGLKVDGQVKTYTYGVPQDDAARTGLGSADILQGKIKAAGPTFTYSPDAYSVSILRLLGDIPGASAGD